MATILVPLDFSPGTHRQVQVAAHLAQALGDSLYLLHVLEPASAYLPIGASMDVVTPPPLEVATLDGSWQSQRLEALAAPLRQRGLAVQTSVMPGLPLEEILQQAEALAARYLVLSSHGHGALYHLFSGSVVTGVLQRARQPVVVVPVRDQHDTAPGT